MVFTVPITITQARKQRDMVEVALEFPSSHSLTVMLVQREAKGKVTRGENAGAVLRHVNVVRFMDTVAPGSGTVRLPLPSDGGPDFLVVALAQSPTTLRIEGAALRPVE